MRAGLVGIAFSRGARHARYVPLGHRALDEVPNLDNGAALRALCGRCSRTSASKWWATT